MEAVGAGEPRCCRWRVIVVGGPSSPTIELGYAAQMRRVVALLASSALCVASCSGDDDTVASPTTSAETTCARRNDRRTRGHDARDRSAHGADDRGVGAVRRDHAAGTVARRPAGRRDRDSCGHVLVRSVVVARRRWRHDPWRRHGRDDPVVRQPGHRRARDARPAKDFTIEHLAIEDTGRRAQGRRARASRSASARRVDRRPAPDNGAYGLYPVQWSNVLIEDTVVIGASDAGVYVGQSDQIVVRNNLARATWPASRSRTRSAPTSTTTWPPTTPAESRCSTCRPR